MTVMIAGGGTGGHVFPMIAVGDALRAVDPEVSVVYVGTARGLEARVIPERGDDLELMNIVPLRGGGLRGFARGAWRAATALPAARALVARRRPDIVLSVGGYAAGPVALAARASGVPLAILEPNSVVGLANRILAPLARRAYTAFPDAETHFRASAVLRAGVPLRSRFAHRPWAKRDGIVSILVLGGSLGAKALNETIPAALAAVVAERGGSLPRIHVVHQTGPARSEEVRALYASLGLTERTSVVPFIDDMAAALEAADLVVARAGASCCAEICAVGRASILIPYPFAADDHQRKNAESLERAGASVAIVQSEATVSRLAREVGGLVDDPARLGEMASRAAAIGISDSATRVAKDLLAHAATTSSERRS